MKTFRFFICFAAAALLAVSCGKDDPVVPVDPGQETSYRGFYLLNEGQWGQNNASLEYFNLNTRKMSSGWWTSNNMDVRSKLGDSGTDVVAYYDYLLVALNGSNLLEISDRNGSHLKAVEIPGCRKIAVKGDFAYVTSYADEGKVYKVNIEKGLVAGTCATGHEPEGVAIIGDKLYVLNSCGNHTDYSGHGDNEIASISVINLNTFTEEDRVNLGIVNAYSPLTVMPDGYSFFINSSGDYFNVAPSCVIFDTKTLSVTKTFNQGGTYAAVYRGELFVMETTYSYITERWEVSAFVYDIFTDTVFDFPVTSATLAGLTAPGGLWIHPTDGEIYIADQGNYTSPGVLYRFDMKGAAIEHYDTGVCPAHIAWDIR